MQKYICYFSFTFIEIEMYSCVHWNVFVNPSAYICKSNIFVNYSIVNLCVCICETLCAFAIIDTDLTP